MHPILETIGLGKFGSNGHPIHPSTVHWPIAFLSVAWVLDLACTLTGESHSTFASLGLGSRSNELARMAYYCHALGVLTAIPATITGAVELYAMISSKGLWQRIHKKSDGSNIYSGLNPTVRIGLIHAALNDIAVFASVHAVWSNWGVTAHRCSSGIAGLWSAIVLGGILYSGYLGGSMVYDYGVGIQRMGEAAKIKEDQQRDEVRGYSGMIQEVERKDL
jgi:uncharacterized membrane protein